MQHGRKSTPKCRNTATTLIWDPEVLVLGSTYGCPLLCLKPSIMNTPFSSSCADTVAEGLLQGLYDMCIRYATFVMLCNSDFLTWEN